jgi:hypothetical protein
MADNLLNAIKWIVEKYGETVLSEPRRVYSLFADLAKEEPKARKNALIKCLEHGFVPILKSVAEADRALCKQRLAEKLHDEEGLDMSLCEEALGLLAAALFGGEPEKKYRANYRAETLYYLSYNYKESGPYSKSDIEKMVANGQITKDYWIRLENSQKWEPVTALFNFPLPPSSSSVSSGYGPMIPPNPYGDNEERGDNTRQQSSPLPQQTYTSPSLSLGNTSFTPTEKSGYKKMCNFIGKAIWVILGVFLLIQILGDGIDPSISFNTMLGCVVFYIIFYFTGKYALKSKCKKCKHFDGANNCTRMNMDVDEAIQFDCLCR